MPGPHFCGATTGRSDAAAGARFAVLRADGASGYGVSLRVPWGWRGWRGAPRGDRTASADCPQGLATALEGLKGRRYL